MLNPRLDRHAPSRRATALVAIVLVLVTLPVAMLRARQGEATLAPALIHKIRSAPSPEQASTTSPAEKKRIVAAAPSTRTPPVLIRPSRQAAPLSGTIYDVSGAVLPGVQVTLVDANKSKWTVSTAATGRFEFPPLVPGKFVLEVALAGFRTLRTEFELREPKDWNRIVTLQVADLSETITVSSHREGAPNDSAVVVAPAQPVRIGGNVRAPKKIKDVHPIYPSAMREAGLTGVVPLEATIGPDGTVSSVRVLSAQIHPDFAVAAADAVRQWRFTPTLLNGQPVAVVMTVTIRFDLDGLGPRQ